MGRVGVKSAAAALATAADPHYDTTVNTDSGRALVVRALEQCLTRTLPDSANISIGTETGGGLKSDLDCVIVARAMTAQDLGFSIRISMGDVGEVSRRHLLLSRLNGLQACAVVPLEGVSCFQLTPCDGLKPCGPLRKETESHVAAPHAPR
jgi:hypothetical protein